MPRKPLAETWESFAERQIREAQEAGEFDSLDGAGRPLGDLDEPYDEFWWVKRKLRREQLSFVPDALAIRREAEAVLEALREVPTEREARDLLAELNERIGRTNAATVSGPPTTLAPLDIEETLRRRWTEPRAEAEWRRVAGSRRPR
jgi:DnaJ-like protein